MASIAAIGKTLMKKARRKSDVGDNRTKYSRADKRRKKREIEDSGYTKDDIYESIDTTKKTKKKKITGPAKYAAQGAVGGALFASMTGGSGNGSTTVNQQSSMGQGGGYDSGAASAPDTYVEANAPTYDSTALAKKGAGMVSSAYESELTRTLGAVRRSIPGHTRRLLPRYIPRSKW